MKPYKTLYKEQQDLNELIGWLKASFKSINQVKGCTKFKALSASDKEYVLDELKSEGWR